ncbi:MAG: type VI secretion system protein TssA [Planctomycetaceae bacterium]|nr:type VI secretion system protein TssA [Planctomycetaceae bacterium]MCB9952121.1 type VI secretion system protein TssA [Planctomycetaceae bacterium]
MASLNFDALLAPVSPEFPCGIDQEADETSNEFWLIRDARREAKSLEDSRSSPADPLWRKLEDLCLEAIATSSKDIRYVAFLTEARLRTSGLSGMADAIELFGRLLNAFGDQLLPHSADGGFQDIVNPMAQLDGKVLEQPLRMQLVTAGTKHQFELWEYLNAQTLESKSQDEKEAANSRGEASLEDVKHSAEETPTQFFHDSLGSITSCRERIIEANESVFQASGERLISFSRIREVLDGLESAIIALAGHRLKSTSSAAQANSSDDSNTQTGVSNVAAAVAAQGDLGSRNEAFSQLNRIAEFFEATEPQSILPSQIRRIVRWGNLKPVELFREVLEDEAARSSMFRLVGIEDLQKDTEDQQQG